MKRLIIIVILLFPSVLFAKEYPVYFEVTELKSLNCGNTIGKKYSLVISERLSEEKTFSLNAGDAGKYKQPLYMVTGTVRYVPAAKGGKNITKYISETEQGGEYRVTVKIVSGETDRTLSTYEDVIDDPAQLDGSAAKTAQKIINGYRNKGVRVPEEDKGPVKPERAPVSLESVEIAPFMSIGFGKYADYDEYGYGAGAAVTIKIYGLRLKPSFDCGYDSPGNDNIRKVIAVRGLLNVGFFRFNAGDFSAVPFIGGGMIYHYVNGDGVGGNESYNLKNFIVNVSLNLDYKISQSTAVFCSPKYNIFFENSDMDMYAEIGTGVKIFF